MIQFVIIVEMNIQMARLQIQTFNYDSFAEHVFVNLVNDFIKTIPMLNIHKIEWHKKILYITYEVAGEEVGITE